MYKTSTVHKGKYIYPKNATLNVRSGPGTNYSIVDTFKAGLKVGLASDEYFYPGGTEKPWIKIALLGPYVNPWVWARTDVIIISSKAKTEPAKTNPTAEDGILVVNNLLKSDQQLAEQLGVLAEMLGRAEENGHVLNDQRIIYARLLKEYTDRQTALKNNTSLKILNYAEQSLEWMQRKSKAAWSWLQNAVGLSGLGIAPALLALIPFAVKSVVVVGAGVTLYMVFKPKYDESKANLVVSGKLKKYLETLPEADQKAIEKDLETQIDSAYKKGLFEGNWGGIFKIVKPIIIGGLALWLVPNIIQKLNSNNKKAVA